MADGASMIDCRIAAARLPEGGETLSVTADDAQCAALARWLEVPGVERFAAWLDVRRWRADGVRIRGTMEADIVQESVVTLEPLRQSLKEPFDLTFAPRGSHLLEAESAEAAELDIDPQAEDPPEAFSGQWIDFGPYLCECLALTIDPYPRERGEAHVRHDTDPEPEAGRRSAFEVLERLVPPDRAED